MKKIFTLVAVISLALTAMSQGITLTFTGAKAIDSSYLRLDSVRVHNITRSWTETLVYPDTVLTFAQTGIAETQGSAAEITSYPNPFNGTTNVSVSMPQSGNATLQVYNLAGQKVVERSMALAAGENLFEVRLQNPQVYLLTVITPQGRSTVKLLNRGDGTENSIVHHGTRVVEKRQSANPFQSGDTLKMVGYITHNDSVYASQEILQPQTASENFTLYFYNLVDILPTVTTDTVSNITDSSVVCGGNVTSDGGALVFARGVCWSTTPNPTISDSHTSDSIGTGHFTSNITGLTPGTTYYIRAYATNYVGTAYGNQVSFTTAAVVVENVFSLSAGTRVFFAPGNLQWSATGGGSTPTTHVTADSTAAGTWRFAPNQWDTVGKANDSLSSSYTGWIDLFHWGTSGYNNKYPYMTSTVYSDYGNGNNDIAGTNYDWGVYNAIYNPQTQSTDPAGMWRTPTRTEWDYLVKLRPTLSGIRFAKGTVNGVPGLILLPDNWDTSTHAINNANQEALFSSNIINSADWAVMENAGAVFLPAGGNRSSMNPLVTINVGQSAVYWTSSTRTSATAYHYYITNSWLNSDYGNRYAGNAVRLVKNTDSTMILVPAVTTDSVSNITDTSVTLVGNVVSDGGTAVTARGFCWDTVPYPTINANHTTDSMGTGTFTRIINGLTPGRTYYIRAYATNSVGTAYGKQDTITTVVYGRFTVGSHTQVMFSPGNLQWSATNGGSTPTTHITADSTAAGTWRFAPNQWDTIGRANSNASSSYTGWIDLFGWGTSGWDNGNYFYQPYDTAKIDVDSIGNGYGPTDGSNYQYSLSGAYAKADWGVYNAIYNPKTLTTDAPGAWRTLSYSEWYYLMFLRNTSSGIRFASAVVNNVRGLIIVPDNWDTATYTLFNPNTISANCYANWISSNDWNNILEVAGCSFLPAAGRRNGVSVTSVNEVGYYSSSTCGYNNGLYLMFFVASGGSRLFCIDASLRGYSVRLVKDINNTPPQQLLTITTTTASSITSTTATSGGDVANDGGSFVTARGVCWSTLQNPTLSNSHTINSCGMGTFTSNLTGLTAGTTYYVRAYAINSIDTAYGNQITFTTTAVAPTVTTTSASGITSTTATSGGNVTSDGGSAVTARGVCWSTSQNPTVRGNHTTNGSGTGSFTSSLTGLTAGTTYYVRAYAINSVDTAYGNQITFSTTAVAPTVTTTSASGITSTTATSGGNVTDNGGSAVTARGVCWGTSQNPTLRNSHTSNSSGTGIFTSNLTGLTAGTTYYVRAYAINSVDTAYGNQITFTTTAAGPYTFSVSAGTRVLFSPGNLQWSAKNGGSTATTHTVAGGGTAAGTWRFAPNQWDTIGARNRNISSSYSGWIDLFGWGTSGWDNGNYFYQPYNSSNSTSSPYTSSNGYGYGPTNRTTYTYSLLGSYTRADWGVYNAIYNPKTSTIDAPGTWRTLTKDEWVYLLNTRSTTSGVRYAKATVNGVPGLIIVPDNWSTSTYALNSTNTTNAAYTTNVISLATWTTLENAGCVFLPAAGLRNGTGVSQVGSEGSYWSARSNGTDLAYSVVFTGSGFYPSNGAGRCRGLSVRLVKDAQ